MNQLYLECLSGISGDMFVASMLDLGADEEVLKKVLSTVPAQGFDIKISRVKKSGLDVCDFDVLLDEVHENHDHDMNFLYGKNAITDDVLTDHHHDHEEDHEHHHHHGEDHEHHHNHEEDHEHHHEESHEHHHDHEGDHEHHHESGHGHHHHEHRGLNDVLEIIEHTEMTINAKEIATRIFTILGKAEAKAHGTTLEEVHFHEVGALDSIVDIISAAVCLDNLHIDDVIIPVLYEGMGTIRCQHGILPVPVPAVSNIIADNHLALHITNMQAELVTPTGAAIAAAIQTKKSLPNNFTIEKIGIGAGKRNYENPSLLRAMLINENVEANPNQSELKEALSLQLRTKQNSDDSKDYIYKLESNIDDCTGENFGYVMERLIEAGAKDVNYMPVYMKKNRPAYQLNVICKEADVPKLEAIIFAETTTIGIRKIAMERSILKREIKNLETIAGTAKVKICEWNQDNNAVRKIYPEYESVVSICKKTGKSFQEVFQMIERTAYDQLGK